MPTDRWTHRNNLRSFVPISSNTGLNNIGTFRKHEGVNEVGK